MKLIAFLAPKTCSHCRVMEKQRVLEKFAEENPSVFVVAVDPTSDDPKDESFARDYRVRSVPTFVFTTDDERKTLLKSSGSEDLGSLTALARRAAARERPARPGGRP